jgi:DNA-binding HxlR family transcriptional regulator
LEIVGERWTLLIMRDAFYGVRRFSDFHSHLGIPKAVLAERLTFLVTEEVLTKVAGEYELTAKGRQLWPMICQRCAQVPDVGDLIAHPPRRPRDPSRDDPVSQALRRPHRMLEPI